MGTSNPPVLALFSGMSSCCMSGMALAIYTHLPAPCLHARTHAYACPHVRASSQKAGLVLKGAQCSS
jgi:hypothetical protein